MSGLISSVQLSTKYPEKKLTLIEKDLEFGGKLRPANSDEMLWSYGLSSVSEGLYNYIDQTFKLDPDAPDLGSMSISRQERLGVLSAGKVDEVLIKDLFSAVGARTIGGGAAARDWKNMDKVFSALEEGRRKDQTFSSLWSGTRKSPAAIAIEHLSRLYGFSDIWSSSSEALISRSAQFGSCRYDGCWGDAIDWFVQNLKSKPQVSVNPECLIVGASFDESTHKWTISTKQGQFICESLIVAQSPWEALDWLPKQFWPSELLATAIKTTPTSIVVLGEIYKGDLDLPNIILVPAESAQIVVTPNKEIYYQATLDFELSMQAPDVIKALKRLKRARKKLHAVYNGIETTGDHMSLLPVAWPQATGLNDLKHSQRLAKCKLATGNLGFCGESYGDSLNGDENFVTSIVNTCASISTSERARW